MGNKESIKNNIKSRALKHYIESGNFGGLTISKLIESIKPDISILKDCLIEMVKDEIIDFYNCPTNPFVKNFDPRNNIEHQLESIKALPDSYDFKKSDAKILKIGDVEIMDDLSFNNEFRGCIYPTKRILSDEYVGTQEYHMLPYFSKLLAEGEDQLKFIFFEIKALDKYFDDPRYKFSCDHDYIGYLSSVSNSGFEEDKEIYLKQFGLGYSKSRKENLVAILLCDLYRLTEAEQGYFRSLSVDYEDAKPDIELLRNTLGEWSETVFIFTAFLQEMKIINEMTKIISKGETLFKKEFLDPDNRPDKFHPYLKPTELEYLNLCQSLSNIFIDNINNECILKMDNASGGKLTIGALKEKGMSINEEKFKTISDLRSLSLLEGFIRVYFTSINGSDGASKVIRIWKKKIYSKRSKVSHSINKNKYDKLYFKKYHDLMEEAYISIKVLRMIFANHPSVKSAISKGNLEIQEELYYGKIRNFQDYY